MAQLPDLTLEPQPSIPKDELGGGKSLLIPMYHDTFRYQIREFRLAYLVMDIGNTGSETLVITDENLHFSILDLEVIRVQVPRCMGLLSISLLGRLRGLW